MAIESDKTAKTVELRTAYCWHCETCAHLNFATAIKHECTDEEKEELFREFHGIDAWQELPDDWHQFDMCYMPTSVKCQNCGEEFSTRDEREAINDEES